jgi:hypothetical protein
VAPALAWARAEEEVLQELERLQQEQRRKMVVLGCWGWIFWAVWDVFFSVGMILRLGDGSFDRF